MAKRKLSLGEAEVTLEYKNNKLLTVKGDETLSDIVKHQFRKSIERIYGYEEKGILYTESENLKPGNKNYIDTVLYERLQNENGIRIGELLDVSENDLR